MMVAEMAGWSASYEYGSLGRTAGILLNDDMAREVARNIEVWRRKEVHQ